MFNLDMLLGFEANIATKAENGETAQQIAQAVAHKEEALLRALNECWASDVK